MLQQTFFNLVSKYTNNKNTIAILWAEMAQHYNHKKRHYHNLTHLDNLLVQLNEVKDQLINWEAVLFALYYHDIVYQAIKKDNEEKSAALAEKRMVALNIDAKTIEDCKSIILATKSHQVSTRRDTNYFTDADLCILGQPWNIYETYYKNIRKEYAIYPNFLYNPGRKKVLTHFLEMESIFKTDFFYNKFELQAKENLKKEIKIL